MDIKQEELWFFTPDTHTLCRAGGNGSNHPSQLYAIKKYVTSGMSFLDYGAGSATTFEALKEMYQSTGGLAPYLKYRGLDVIEKNTKWCTENFPDGDFKFNPTLHKIDEPDKSWDVVYSRHVVDHMNSFEEAMDEHCRVAKELVIVVFWVPMADSDDHQIKNIVDQGKVYTNEFTNSYSRKKVKEWIDSKVNNGWELLEWAEDIGSEVKGHDWVLILKRK